MKFAHRISLAIGGILLCYGLISGFLIDGQLQERLLQEQSAWASTLTSTMAEGVVRDTLNGDALHVRETLRNIVHTENRLIYAYVVDFEGRLFAHSFDKGFPKALIELASQPGSHNQLLSTTEGRMLNTSHSLVEDTNAALHLGIGLAESQRQLNKLQRQQLYVFMGVGLLALMLAIYLGRQLSRPLDKLVTSMRYFGSGQAVSDEILGGGSKEINELGQAFTKMMIDRSRLETELKQLNTDLESRVKARTRELEDANKELEAFSYSVSHDLRAPLRAVEGFSLILLEDYAGQLDDTGLHYLERVRNGAQKMDRLVNDILKLSRVTRMPHQVSDVNLSVMAEEIVTQLRENTPERNVRVDIAGGMHCQGDPGLLRITLDNLLGNAWKYTGKTADAHITFNTGHQDGQTVFQVRDNGVGFDMEFTDKLFGAFQRMHGLDEFEGTGIGLATVQRIIHRHGGRIWAEGEPGKGAVFRFTLGHSEPISDQ